MNKKIIWGIVIVIVIAIGVAIIDSAQIGKPDADQPSTIKVTASSVADQISNWKVFVNSKNGYSISYPPTYHTAFGDDLFNFDENLYERGNDDGVKIQIQKTSGTVSASKADVPVVKYSERVPEGPGGTFDIYSVTGSNGTKYFQILVWGGENDSQNVAKILSTFRFTN
ncbi:MAG: hypothetical protein Q8Q03_00035 [bacterium]|nr:hypothetical protein [bacterium]